MSKNEGGAAFPIPHGAEVRGLSVRDYFAAKAMQGLIASETPYSSAYVAAVEAYELADAMLAERAK